MLRSYQAIYHDGALQWLDAPPRLKHARVMVVIAEPGDEPIPEAARRDSNGPRLARILRDTDASTRAGIADAFGDPVAWQREQRRERTLPGREER
ncbi:hypothetical protein [Methylomagnum sp.]